jgi:hypothetical protein
MTTLEQFKPGMRVILARVRHADWQGVTGTVRRAVKSRQVVTVDCDGKGHYSLYDAKPENLDIIQ